MQPCTTVIRQVHVAALSQLFRSGHAPASDAHATVLSSDFAFSSSIAKCWRSHIFLRRNICDRAAPYVMRSELHYGLHSIAVIQVESAGLSQVFRSGHASASDAHAAVLSSVCAFGLPIAKCWRSHIFPQPQSSRLPTRQLARFG